MVTIKRLTEEIGFDYSGKKETTDIKPVKNKKKNPMLDMILPILKPVVKSAFEAGKSGENFDEWWGNYVETEGGKKVEEKSPPAKKLRRPLGYKK